jgi:hypothetical protein
MPFGDIWGHFGTGLYIRFKSQSTDWSVNTNWSNLIPRKSLAFANVDDNHYVGRIRRKNFQGDRIISSYTPLYSHTKLYPVIPQLHPRII